MLFRIMLLAAAARALTRAPALRRASTTLCVAAPADDAGPEPAKWLLIDGTNLIYRSFYGMPSLGSEDAPVGATLGVSNALLKVALPYAVRGARIVFCLDVRNEAVKAMQYPPDTGKKKQPDEDDKEEKQTDEEIAKEIEEELGDELP